MSPLTDTLKDRLTKWQVPDFIKHELVKEIEQWIEGELSEIESEATKEYFSRKVTARERQLARSRYRRFARELTQLYRESIDAHIPPRDFQLSVVEFNNAVEAQAA